jgi:lipopolysaccharide/colanic/teichoic acid biosynthesis glycosyltransferase
VSAHLRGQRVVDVRQLLKEFRGRVDIHNTDGWTFLLASTQQSFFSRFYFYVKSLFEPVLALALLVILSPLFIAVAIAILATSGRPIFFKQDRLGYRGKRFSLYKFRTMTTQAEEDGARWASKNDPRITPLGYWLRRTRIDEFPQFFNVLRGDMGFVGPRPERPEFYELLSKHIPLFSMRLLVRPGITGWAQVKQGYAASIEECRTKLEYDLYYVQSMSPRLDMRVLVHTATMTIRGNGGR